MELIKLKYLLNNCYLYRLLVYKYKKYSVERNPIKEIERCYKLAYGKKPNLINPQNYVEKIYWMEWHIDTSLWSKCTDKFLVRKYLKECNVEYYAPKLLAKWDKPEDIDFSSLPNEFIIKTNDGCGTNCIIRDKNATDINLIKRKFSQFLRFRQGYNNAQYHYLTITPCIIAEELLHQSSELNKFSPKSLVDYKIYCFNGEPECICLMYNRTKNMVYEKLLDLEWNDISYNLVQSNHFMIDSNRVVPKPNCLSEMLKLARKLSRPFPQVRVDFYNINGRPVFGELTFSSGYGDFREDYLNYLGSLIDLSKLKKINKSITDIRI